MVRYIVEKIICDNYAHGYMTLMEDNKPKTFISKKAANDYLTSLKISAKEIAEVYNIKPYVI